MSTPNTERDVSPERDEMTRLRDLLLDNGKHLNRLPREKLKAGAQLPPCSPYALEKPLLQHTATTPIGLTGVLFPDSLEADARDGPSPVYAAKPPSMQPSRSRRSSIRRERASGAQSTGTVAQAHSSLLLMALSACHSTPPAPAPHHIRFT